jgi:phage-related minor tail protein
MKELADANQKGSVEYAKLEQQTKALSKTKQALSRETQNEIKLEYEEKGSLNALRAELSNLTKQYDKLSRAERENVNVGGKLKNQINQVTKELKAAEEGTQRYYRNVGNYQNAILGAIGVNSQFLTSMVGMENGTKGAFAAMSASAKAFGKTLMSLMSNPVFLAIAGIAGAGMAAKWFYDYNMGVEQAMRLTREFTHTSGQELSNLRAEIQATANTYGKDYKDVLQAVDTLMSHYHISGKEAIDTINDGFQAGADLNGDMLQKLQQYAPTFRDAGISADRFMAIMSQTRSGIFSEQGLDAIKQGSARIREMSNTTRTALQKIGIDVDEMQAKLRSGQMDTFDAIQQVANKLKELPDNAQEVGEVMSAVFGRQGNRKQTAQLRYLYHRGLGPCGIICYTKTIGKTW